MDSKPTLPLCNGDLSKNDRDLHKSRCHLKPQLCTAVSLVLGLVAIVGACAVVAVVYLPSLRRAETNIIDFENEEELHHSIVEDNQMAKRNAANNLYTSCYSESTNDSTPAAHIAGRGIKWGIVEPAQLGPGKLPFKHYKTRWNCKSTHGTAFVSGGMNFSQDDEQLYFPTCGFYYVSSQVLFQYSLIDNEPNQNLSVFHSIHIKPNCDSDNRNIQHYLHSHSSLVQKEYYKVSTYIGDVVKICTGGWIKIIIPMKRNLCCAHGDSMSTHFSAFLVQETECS